MTFRSNDPYADFDREDMDIARAEKMLPHCSFCGEPITTDYYKHFTLMGRDYIICDDCLEEDDVDTYITAHEIGEVL
jgi:hypothetical protein